MSCDGPLLESLFSAIELGSLGNVVRDYDAAVTVATGFSRILENNIRGSKFPHSQRELPAYPYLPSDYSSL